MCAKDKVMTVTIIQETETNNDNNDNYNNKKGGTTKKKNYYDDDDDDEKAVNNNESIVCGCICQSQFMRPVHAHALLIFTFNSLCIASKSATCINISCST